MDLRESKTEIKKRLLHLVTKGSQLRDSIDREYRTKRSNKTFNPEQDVASWNRQYGGWFAECLKAIEQLFEPAILVINRFKNPKIDATYPDGENMKWASLMKNLNTRLELLDNLYQLANAIKEEELSDYIELSVPFPFGRIKVDKIISKIMQ